MSEEISQKALVAALQKAILGQLPNSYSVWEPLSSDILKSLMGTKVTKYGFLPVKHKITYARFAVHGVVGLDGDSFICDPAIPTSQPFFVVGDMHGRGCLLCNGSYCYYKTHDCSRIYTTSHLEIINEAISDFVKNN